VIARSAALPPMSSLSEGADASSAAKAEIDRFRETGYRPFMRIMGIDGLRLMDPAL
jgi:hypothetical protein